MCARRDKTAIDALDVDGHMTDVIAGPAKRKTVLSRKEREMSGLPWSGHTIVGMVLSDARVVHKSNDGPSWTPFGGNRCGTKKMFLNDKKKLFEQSSLDFLVGSCCWRIYLWREDYRQVTTLNKQLSFVAWLQSTGMVSGRWVSIRRKSSKVFIGRDYEQTKAYSNQEWRLKSTIRRIMKEAHEKSSSNSWRT